jgi:hypothetical protein
MPASDRILADVETISPTKGSADISPYEVHATSHKEAARVSNHLTMTNQTMQDGCQHTVQ